MRKIFVIAATVFNVLAASYTLGMELKGEKWAIFTEHPKFHEITIIAILILLPIVNVGLAAAEWRERQARKDAEDLLIEFFDMVRTIVDSKTRSLLSRVKTLRNKSVAGAVRPGEQILTIFSSSSTFLRKVFALSESQLDITILEYNPITTKWRFYQTLRSRMNHDATSLMSNPDSAARIAISRSSPIFFPSKTDAAGKNQYRPCSKDPGNRDGSIYCHPVKVEFLGNDWQYVISITTYGKRLCDPKNHATISKVQELLTDLTRRLELELIIRTVQES